MTKLWHPTIVNDNAKCKPWATRSKVTRRVGPVWVKPEMYARIEQSARRDYASKLSRNVRYLIGLSLEATKPWPRAGLMRT